MKQVELAPIKETPSDFDLLEAKIVQIFRKYIYLPLILEAGADKKIIKNDLVKSDLEEAFESGQIRFHRGVISGRFSARITRELKKLGAKFDKRSGTFLIRQSDLPPELQNSILISEARMTATLQRVDRKLQQILPDEVADKLSVEKIFDTTLWKTDRAFRETIKGISVAPNLTDEERAKIAAGYTEDLRRYIKDFTEKEINKLRSQIAQSTLSGNRYERLVKTIQKSYEVSLNKAKFLARQETGLMMAKFKEARYQSAGINEYKWHCVAGSKHHPVRPMHKALEGKTFTWDNPPVTDSKGQRNNPGEDYNCRCFARPIVKFK